MRGKAKQRVSLILVVTMVLGTVLTGNTVFAAGESSDEQDRIKINISKDSEQTVEQNVTQTIHVTAQGQCSQSVCLNVYLKNEDGSAATDIDAVNLLTSDQLTDKNTQKTIDETLKDSVTLNNGTKASPTAEWKNDKDDNGTVTSKYLQITMPTDTTAINFDMQLQYRTDEASYTKKVLVEAKAFEEEQDITEAAKRADESKENEVTVVWEGQAVSQSESEAADEDTDGENALNAVAEENQYTVYFQQSNIEDTRWNNATQIYIYAFNDGTDNLKSILPMAKEGGSNLPNVWKYTFNKQWKNVIFLRESTWPKDNDKSSQTVDLQIDWKLNQPCFKLTGDDEQGTGKKNAAQSKYQYQGTTQPADGITVYYDATLSKLSYEDNKKGIPNPDSTVYYYATNGTKSTEGEMTKEKKEINGYDYNDVYKVTLPKGYGKIRFAANPVSNANDASNGEATALLDIPSPSVLTNPCYYGDSSDNVIYDRGNRGGYWEEAYTVRDAETGKATTVVDVPNAVEKRNEDELYVNTTIYDYYSDYELNGLNRDNYQSNIPVNSHRIYQPFRQFNMAVSDYYQVKGATSPLYWGNFQNYNDATDFKNIAGTMNLFGYPNSKDDSNLYQKFFYENNSMCGSDGNKLSSGNNATQGLVANQLNNNSLQLKTDSGTALAPFFDKDFLNGNNSKNTVLGKVYENVTFPFVKKAMRSSSTESTGTLDYWYFNSADKEATNKNLQLKYDATDEYFLQSNNEEVKGSTTNGATANGNYFPLNSQEQSGKASQLNYGFGQKFDLKFRLTSDGKVLDSANKEVPIEFNFSGDDDVWVFIDDQLVLDIGGDHAVVTGRIDFANKKATVSSAKNSSLGGTSNGEVEKDFPKELDTNDYFTKEHTLTMFYMERGLWESNMQITFNFPQENTLTVEKEVDTTGANDIFKKALEDVGTFDFEIKNLATSGPSKEVSDPSSPEVKQVFNDYTNPSTISGTGVKNSSVEVVDDSTGNGKGKLISSYYPGEKKSTDTQEKTDSRLVKIQASGKGTFDALDSKGYKYLQFDVYNTDENASGTDPFVALVDEDGTRIGAWASFLTYNGRNNNIDNKIWKTIRIDLNKLKKKTLDEGTTSGFDFSKVKEIQFAYWDDVTVYLDKFAFVKPASVEKTGFTTEQEDIPDYGSIKSKKLEPVNGAYYQNTNGDTIIYSDGLLSIGNKESAIFSDQFRRGSYLSIAEKNVSSDVFTTTWSLYEKGVSVNQSDLSKNTYTVIGGENTSVEKQSGYKVNDGRKENAKVKKPDESTIVFRSYMNPDSENTVIDLKAKYVNKLRTGSISLKKELSNGESETQTGRNYKFIIEYRNVAGMKLEANTGTDVIKQEIELEANEQQTITGIPAGTDYTIYEEIPESADYSLEKVKVTAYGNDKNIKAENNVVTGIVVADDGDNPTSTGVTFVNTVTPLISISGTKTWEGGETKDTPDNIVVQIQRFNPDTKEYEQAKDKLGELIPNQIVDIDTNWKYIFTGLLKYVDYTATSQQEYQYRVVELGTLKSSDELGSTIPDPQNPDHIKQITGYYPEYTTESNGSYNITNRKTGSLKIIKKTGKNESLAGAKFTLYKDAEATQVATDCTGKELTGITGDNGELVFDNIIAGTEENPITYYLKEVKTKAGYVLLKEPIKIILPYKYKVGDIVNGNKVTESGVTWNLTYTIINDKAFDLPASGNKGIFKFIVIGITAVLVGGYLLTARKKSRKKRVSRRG